MITMMGVNTVMNVAGTVTTMVGTKTEISFVTAIRVSITQIGLTMIDERGSEVTMEEIGKRILRKIEHYHYCDDCKYKKVNWHDEPCTECAHGIKDRWEKDEID